MSGHDWPAAYIFDELLHDRVANSHTTCAHGVTAAHGQTPAEFSAVIGDVLVRAQRAICSSGARCGARVHAAVPNAETGSKTLLLPIFRVSAR